MKPAHVTEIKWWSLDQFHPPLGVTVFILFEGASIPVKAFYDWRSGTFMTCGCGEPIEGKVKYWTHLLPWQS